MKAECVEQDWSILFWRRFAKIYPQEAVRVFGCSLELARLEVNADLPVLRAIE
jgi:hypothetical protein